MTKFSDAEAWSLHEARERRDAAVSSYNIKLPYDREYVAQVYQQLSDAEEAIVPNGDYKDGSAKEDDDVLVLSWLGGVMLTAEHATDQVREFGSWRIQKRKEADFGTGGLAVAIANKTLNPAIIAIGRQTGDANNTLIGHRVLQEMAEIMERPQTNTHYSLHLLNSGRSSYPRDNRGFSVILGIGPNPTEATLALKDELVKVGSDLDLKVGVNEYHLEFENRRLLTGRNGRPRRSSFSGTGPTTRTYSQSLAERLGKDGFASIQMEINRVLLIRQNNETAYPSQFDKELGAYLGYLFVKLAVEKATILN